MKKRGVINIIEYNDEKEYIIIFLIEAWINAYFDTFDFKKK